VTHPLCPQCGAPVETTEAFATCASCGARFAAGEAKTNVDQPPAPDPLIGTVVGGCRLTERIGSGGMGVVYKGEQVSLGRVVAIKLLPEPLRQDPQIRDRFSREIEILAKLNHPNIVGILDGGVGEHGAYFIMEYVDGVSLRKILTSGGVTPAEALRIIPQICEALDYAHGIGIIHRDIKPENILIDRTGRVRLLDFGLSRVARQDGPSLLTRPTQVLGTFEYMAPEQREASRSVDHRADLYSLGVVIYEMLTNELPIGRFEPPSHKNIHIDVRLDDVVLRVLEKSPERRYQRASDLKTEVQRISMSPPETAAPPVVAPVPAPAASASPPSGSPPTPTPSPPTQPANAVERAATAVAGAAASAASAAAAAPAPPAPSGAPATPQTFGSLHDAEWWIPGVVVAIVGVSTGSWLPTALVLLVMYLVVARIRRPAPVSHPRVLWYGMFIAAVVGLSKYAGSRNSGVAFEFHVIPPFLFAKSWVICAGYTVLLAWLTGFYRTIYSDARSFKLWLALSILLVISTSTGTWAPGAVLGALCIILYKNSLRTAPAASPAPATAPPDLPSPSGPPAGTTAESLDPARVSRLANLAILLAISGIVLSFLVLPILFLLVMPGR
jgi:serine/threonine protein kinase